MSPSPSSAVSNHVAICNSSQNFTISKCCTNECNLSILEALYICEQKPKVNTALAEQGTSVLAETARQHLQTSVLLKL